MSYFTTPIKALALVIATIPLAHASSYTVDFANYAVGVHNSGIQEVGYFSTSKLYIDDTNGFTGDPEFNVLMLGGDQGSPDEIPDLIDILFDTSNILVTAVHLAGNSNATEIEVNNIVVNNVALQDWSHTLSNPTGISSFSIHGLESQWSNFSFDYTNSASSNPVPLPGIAWMFGLGLTGLIGFSRKKKVKL